jgi:hypothetical protein
MVRPSAQPSDSTHRATSAHQQGVALDLTPLNPAVCGFDWIALVAWSRLYRQGEDLRAMGELSEGTRVLFEAKGWTRDPNL